MADFMRTDVNLFTSERTFFYRMPDDLKEFIEKVEAQTGKEVAVITLERNQDGTYGRNVGIVV